jgi:hypothetical protein
MKIVTVPIKVSNYTEEELIKHEELGISIKDDDGIEDYMDLNVDQIVSYLSVDDEIDLELSTGRRITIYMSIKKFREVIND